MLHNVRPAEHLETIRNAARYDATRRRNAPMQLLIAREGLIIAQVSLIIDAYFAIAILLNAVILVGA